MRMVGNETGQLKFKLKRKREHERIANWDDRLRIYGKGS